MLLETFATPFSTKELPGSEIELAGEVPAEALAPYREQALASIAKGLELPGFRKGFVPPDMALKKVGETAVLHEAAELFVRDFYPVLVAAKKLDVVGRPEVSITKLAPGNPLGLVIRTALYPAVELPDWKKLSGEISAETSEPVTDKEVEETLETLRKNREEKAEDGGTKLPELNDEFAREIGAFATLDDLKAQVRKGIGEEKERKARDARRGKILDALIERTSVSIPAVFVESELEKMLAQMKDDVVRFGLTFEEYLKRVEKTEETLREELRESAVKRAKLQLTLNKLAEEEKIEADETAIEEEMKHALEHFPGAKPELVRIHIETVLRNEKVLQRLEGSEKTEVKE